MKDTDLVIELQKLEQTLDSFSWIMWDKLKKKAGEGYRDWDNPNYKTVLRNKLHTHLARVRLDKDYSSYVDIANLAMFLYYLEKEEKDGIST